MNIQNALLKENSNANIECIAHFIGNDEVRFAELLHCFLHVTYRECQKAAFAFKLCLDAYPEMINNWWQAMLTNLDRPIHHAVIRNTLSVWLEVELPEKYHGEIYKRAFNYLTNSKMPIAVRAHAISICTKLALIYPELKNEILTIAKDFIALKKAALNARAKYCIKTLT